MLKPSRNNIRMMGGIPPALRVASGEAVGDQVQGDGTVNHVAFEKRYHLPSLH
jgi:hypothetical protein